MSNMRRYAIMIEETLNEHSESAYEISASIPLNYETIMVESSDVDRFQETSGVSMANVLSQETLVNILDKQWVFNGVPRLRFLYKTLRAEAFENHNFDEYQLIFNAFESALEERSKINLRQLLTAMGINKQDFNRDLELQYPRDIFDYSYIINVSEWQGQKIPAHLTVKLAMLIHSEIIETQKELLISVSLPPYKPCSGL